MATNTALLKSKMILHNDTMITLADYLGINRQNTSVKVNGKREFKQSEIAKIIRRYKLSDREFRAIFIDGYDFEKFDKEVHYA